MSVKTLILSIIVSLFSLTNFEMGFCQTRVRLVPKPVSDEALIKAEVRQCVQAVRSHNPNSFKYLLSQNFKDVGTAIQGREPAFKRIKQVFENKKARTSNPEFKKNSPPSLANNPMWDFDIKVIQVDVSGERATVECELLWHTLHRNKQGDNKKAMNSEVLIFEREYHRWRLKESKQLLIFLNN